MVIVGTLWVQPAHELLEDAEPGMPAVWSAVFAAQNAALWLEASNPDVGDSSTTEASMDLTEALSELEWVQPWLAAGDVVDLGPVASPDEYELCVLQAAELVRAAVEQTVRMLAAPEVELTVPELVSLSRAVKLLSDAHVRLTGRLM